MKKPNIELLPNLTKKVVSEPKGFMLDAYLIALEGFRRGLTLTWYKAESDVCKLDRLNGSTEGKFFSLSSDLRTHYFFRSRGDKVANKTVRLVQNKDKTKDMLLKGGIPVPEGKGFNVEDPNDHIIQNVLDIGFPVVIKPRNGSMGKAVYTNILSKVEIIEALEDLREKYRFKEYIIEKYYAGNEYRIYVVGDEVVAATNRVPANVVGDGKTSIRTLIDIKNKEKKKNPYLARKPIKVDFEVRNSLKRYEYNLDSIPENDEVVYLRRISNLSSGGDPIDATDILTKEIKQIAVNTLKALPSIQHAGVDIIVDPNSDTSGIVLEVNATAEIAFHMFPWEGKARDIPGAIIDYYFPETQGNKKSNQYFDFKSIQVPLSLGVIEEIKIPKPSFEPTYGKKYIASGKVNKVGYMNWIKRQALRDGLNGHVKKLEDERVEIVVCGSNKENVNLFKEKCRQGSRASIVREVVEMPWQENQPMQIGFQLITL